MEKIVYILWRPAGLSPAAFRESLLGETATAVRAAGARRLAVNVSDEDVAYALERRLAYVAPPIAGVVSFWLDLADARGPAEAALARVTERLAGYLVVESVPIVNTTHVAAPGARTPGTNLIACITPRAGMAYEDFIRHWHGHHCRVAIETQCTYAYVRNEIVRPLTSGAPAWAAIVEEGFPAEAVTDPMRWYRAEGSLERCKENMRRMLESCQAFLALDRIESHPMSEYILER